MNPNDIVSGTATKIKMLVKNPIGLKNPNFPNKIGITANWAENVVKRFSRQDKNPSSDFILKNFRIAGLR